MTIRPETLPYVIPEVAAMTGLRFAAVRALLRSGELRGYHHGTGKWYVMPESLGEYLTAGMAPRCSCAVLFAGTPDEYRALDRGCPEHSRRAA